MKSLLFSIMALSFAVNAQAQYVDQSGFTDYGMLHNTVIGGSVVPDDRPLMKAVTARIMTVVIRKSDLNEAGTGMKQGIERDMTMGRCSGTVIAPEVILTAAHCIRNDQWEPAMFVILGKKEYRVKSYVRHPKYKELKKKDLFGYVFQAVLPEHDMALIFLSDKIAEAKTALLPPTGARLTNETDLILAGFGRTSPDGIADDTLRSVTVRGKETRKDGISIVGGKTICSGDSGGPAFVQDENRYIVVGVTSTGNCVNTANLMRVSDYVDWIKAEIEKFRSQHDI